MKHGSSGCIVVIKHCSRPVYEHFDGGIVYVDEGNQYFIYLYYT